MPGGYRLAVVALGLAASAALGQTQEQTEEAQRQTEQQQAPAQPFPLPFPVEVVEDQTEAEARNRREAEADQREIDDLRAQQGMNEATQAMNDATQRMAVYSLYSTGLIFVGTVALIATLYLTNKTIVVTRQVGQQQTRAYVYPSFIGFFDAEEIGVEGLPADWATVAIHIKNYGQSPAKQARAVMSREVWNFPPPQKDRKPLPLPDFAEDRSDMPPGNESENRLDFTLSEAERERIEDGISALYVFGRVEYLDTFNDPHFTNFLLYSTGEDFLTGKFRTLSFGNEAS